MTDTNQEQEEQPENKPESRWVRAWKILWAAGLIVGIPGQLYAGAVRHNYTEAWVLLLIAFVLYMPLFIYSTVQMRKSTRELKKWMHEFEIKKVVIDVLASLEEAGYFDRKPAPKPAMPQRRPVRASPKPHSKSEERRINLSKGAES